MKSCPYKPGDVVVYSPSERGYALEDGDRLVIGKPYKIERIERESYIVIEGYRNAGGGIYWTEFIPVGKS
jgi:hypothetical protein